MKPHSLIDAAGAAALEFDWLAEAVRPVSEYGLRIFADVRPFVPGEEEAARARARRIAGCASGLELERLDSVRDALRTAPDVIGTIARASMGGALADAELFALAQFCDVAARADALLADAPGFQPPFNRGVRRLQAALAPGRGGSYQFYLADAFDAALADSRALLERAQRDFERARDGVIATIAHVLKRDDISSDEFVVMRDDLHGDLPTGVRILRDAPTYVLCAVELDEASLAALERRDAAAEAVADAEAAVRRSLAELVASVAAQLDAAAAAFGEIDVLVGAARFAKLYDCHAAHIVDTPSLAFEDGRFLPLAAELAREGRAFAPIALDLRDVAVLTGPNMGGKSVCLRTCGFIALCAAFGLPVPAKRASTGLFDEIAWLGIGTQEERPGGLLSSFAREVVRLREVLEGDATRLLVLFDEFARTTTPLEGKALLVAVLSRLQARGACGLAATHLDGIARDADARHFSVRGLRGIPQAPAAGDLHQALAALAASMDYTIAEVTGESPGSADAIALAALLGLDARIVERAREYLENNGRTV